ncbi:hypothetical protein DFQ09_111125 [Winogradskyella pacifica]|uniref:Uncharacterized protein n=2 Tax=Winogradskyella pacifica TaxID=664642 RepID=A0A3D9LKL3_9FLAO|nr:hypothetical protein DFQ09_111125 [Winogradskyella pacifica]
MNRRLVKLIILGILSSAFVVILFMISEHEVHRNNAFIRRYPHQPIYKMYDIAIKYNSYYIAGFDTGNLYLGNKTAPLHLLQVNLKTKDTSSIKIKLDRVDLPFRSIKVKMYPPYFFMMDGSVPYIFRGKIGDWKASLWMKDKAYFDQSIPIDTNRVFMSTISSKTQMITLGLIEKNIKEDFEVLLSSDILEKQIDGTFDVDGLMTISPDYKTLGYVYFYRNEFMIMDSNLNLLKRSRTIDTVKKAQIRISKTDNNGASKMSAPPLIVNNMVTVYDDFLFINSNRLGKYESKDVLKEALIVDVYNWDRETYEFSFYIYNIGKESAKEFGIYNNSLVALIDNKLSVYGLREHFFNKDLVRNYPQTENMQSK